MLKIKESNDKLTEDLIENALWSYIYVPTNSIIVNDKSENIWFGGYLVGYEISKIFYDFKDNKEIEECTVTYSLILSDGAGFPLSNDSEIFTLTEEEFTEMLSEYVMEGVEDVIHNQSREGASEGTLWDT